MDTLVFLGLVFMAVLMGVPFLDSLLSLLDRAKQHEKFLRRLAKAKLIGLTMLVPSVLFGLSTTVQVFNNPETFFGSLPTLGLCWLGTWIGMEIVLPTTPYL